MRIRFWQGLLALASLGAGCRSTSDPVAEWNRMAPISFDTAVTLSRALYLRRAALITHQETAPNSLLRLYIGTLLKQYGIEPSRWDSLRSYLLAHPDQLLVLQESTLAALTK